MFGVDDIIVKNPVDLTYCTELMETTGAFGFYLRLGRNITECYTHGTVTGLPPLYEIAPDVYTWQFVAARGKSSEWNYMGTFDMTLYRKADIKHVFTSLDYSVPNVLARLHGKILLIRF